MGQNFNFLFLMSKGLFMFLIFIVLIHEYILLLFQEFILLIDNLNQFINFCNLISTKALKNKFISSSSRESSSSLDELYLGEFPVYTSFFISFTMRHMWPTLGKREDLLKARVAKPSSSKSKEIASESHYLPIWASPPFLNFFSTSFFLLLSSSYSLSLYGQFTIKWTILPHLKHALLPWGL
jgi:hypothetical protein